MKIAMENITVGTVIVVQGKLAIVEEIMSNRTKNPIHYRNNTRHRGYICSLEDIQAILGDVDIAEWKGAFKPQSPKVTVERNDSWAMPQKLLDMDIKVGDTIIVKHGRKTRTAIYRGFNANRPKYPISYEINGNLWKGTRGIISQKVS